MLDYIVGPYRDRTCGPLIKSCNPEETDDDHPNLTEEKT